MKYIFIISMFRVLRNPIMTINRNVMYRGMSDNIAKPISQYKFHFTVPIEKDKVSVEMSVFYGKMESISDIRNAEWDFIEYAEHHTKQTIQNLTFWNICRNYVQTLKNIENNMKNITDKNITFADVKVHSIKRYEGKDFCFSSTGLTIFGAWIFCIGLIIGQ